MSVGFKEDMKQLIFDPIHFPADLDLFKDEEWQLGIFEEKEKEGEKI